MGLFGKVVGKPPGLPPIRASAAGKHAELSRSFSKVSAGRVIHEFEWNNAVPMPRFVRLWEQRYDYGVQWRLFTESATMAILYHPRPGDLLMCDYNTGFKVPEMVKKRPVVVVSKARQQLVTVVPLSTTPPFPIETCHYEVSQGSLPNSLQGDPCWAKCDMIGTVALWRLDRIMNGKCPTTGKRIYLSHRISQVDLEGIKQAIRAVLYL